jgi:hypothetical protein
MGSRLEMELGGACKVGLCYTQYYHGIPWECLALSFACNGLAMVNPVSFIYYLFLNTMQWILHSGKYVAHCSEQTRLTADHESQSR